MRFVFKHHKPILIFAIYFNRYNNGAGIDFFGLIQILQLTLFTQLFHADNSNVHQGYRTIGIFAVHLVTGSHVFIICFLNRLSESTGNNVHIFDLRHKCSMTAVVGPISIQYTNFCNSRFAVFLIKIFLAPKQILQAHS